MFRDVPVVLFDLDGTLIDSAPDLAAAADLMRVGRQIESGQVPKTSQVSADEPNMVSSRLSWMSGTTHRIISRSFLRRWR